MKQVTKYSKNSRVRTCWLRLAVLIPQKIRTCLVKHDQAGSVQCGLQLINNDEHFNQGVWLWDCKVILPENTLLTNFIYLFIHLLYLFFYYTIFDLEITLIIIH